MRRHLPLRWNVYPPAGSGPRAGDSGKLRQLWLVDWTTGENDGFAHAFTASDAAQKVVWAEPPNESPAGWAAFAQLAWEATLHRGHDVIIAWQPLAAALAALAPRRRPPIIAINPQLSTSHRLSPWRIIDHGLRRCETITMGNVRGIDGAIGRGFARNRLSFLPLGRWPNVCRPGPLGDYVIAAGRSHRDWDFLAAVASGLDIEVKTVSRGHQRPGGKLTVLPEMPRGDLLDLMRRSRAVLIPLDCETPTAGTLVALDAMSVGRGIVSTRNQGTEDYVLPTLGELVEVGDVDGFREAVRRACEPDVAHERANHALQAVRTEFSAARFVTRLGELAARLLGPS